ncbi:MAG TPA: serine hydrolase domain-containing protein [Actinocatenispora sp.]
MLDELAEHCAEALTRYDCPSVSVAVVERGRVVYAEAYGLADVATGRPATPDTAYGLCSVTKPVTATAVCVAHDAGLLDLDSPVPDGDPRWAAPTVRDLLRHRAGLGAYYDWDYGDGAPRIDPDRYTTRYRAPGAAFEYANLGYRTTARVLETATGRSLAGYARDAVFAPLGLDSCHIGRSHPGPAPTAVRYTVDGRAYPDYDCGHPGATLGWASAPDLALFAQTYDRLLAPETAAATRDALPVNDHLGYGLGWCVSSGDGPVVLSHGGGGGGVAALAFAVPERQLAAAVLCNSTNKAARDTVVRHLLSALVPGAGPEGITPAVPDPVRPLALTAARWAGGIVAPERTVPLEVRVRADRSVELRIDGAPVPAEVDASTAWDLRAHLAWQLPTADARVNSPTLGIALRLDGEALVGVAHAYKEGDAEGWLGNFLNHPVELSQCSSDSELCT